MSCSLCRPLRHLHRTAFGTSVAKDGGLSFLKDTAQQAVFQKAFDVRINTPIH